MLKQKLKITANHYGWFEFRLCNRDENGGAEATHECLNKYLLADASGNTRFNIGSTLGKITTQVRLPSGLSCQQCVIQVKEYQFKKRYFNLISVY